MLQKNKIKVIVDKSHLFTLGEKMYRESIEFVRELVNNAYDADATDVFVLVSDEKIEVFDNGSGMNDRGLTQFFTIGSEEKRTHGISPRFGRKRIGQFGIGKFSALALADEFIVESVKGKYKYTVIFNRSSWKSEESWELPIEKQETTPLDQEGTKIILNHLTKKITIAEVEKYLKQSVPLRAKKFNVYLNNKKITAKTVAGKITSINIKTMYGPIIGEIVLALSAHDVDEPGIECRVKEVFIKREMFNMAQKYHHGLNRVTGSVNVDFLPLIANRSDFITDSPEYKLFFMIMRAQLEYVLKEFKKQSDVKNLKKINKELQEIMKQIKEALMLNPDFVPQGKAITRLKKEGRKKIAAGSVIIKSENLEEKELDKETENENEKKIEKKEQKEKQPEIKIDVKPLAIKKIRLKKLGISCGIVSLGETGPEVLSQGNLIYINQDHPLYQKFYKKAELFSLHLLRLVTQEIVLMKKLRITASEAFAWQGKLLKDAMCK
ncbi:MAG: ATP-binding protein [Patescibacteria group bacterium]